MHYCKQSLQLFPVENSASDHEKTDAHEGLSEEKGSTEAEMGGRETAAVGTNPRLEGGC